MEAGGSVCAPVAVRVFQSSSGCASNPRMDMCLQQLAVKRSTFMHLLLSNGSDRALELAWPFIAASCKTEGHDARQQRALEHAPCSLPTTPSFCSGAVAISSQSLAV